MNSLFGGSGIRTLRMMIKKGLIKVEDLNTPPDGWFIGLGYERETGTGKWKRILRTKCGATPSLAVHKLPKYRNSLTGKITFDPYKYEEGFYG